MSPGGSAKPPVMLTAKDIMTRKVVRLRPDMSIIDAAKLLVRKGISGAPVVDADGRLLGFLSELDCLRIVASGDFTAEDFQETTPVSDFMTEHPHAISRDLGIFSIAHLLVTHRIRNLPVVENGILVGQVRRRDVLTGIGKMRRERLARSTVVPGTEREPRLYLSATDSSPGLIAKKLE